jgi:hypothetical protein
MKAKYSLRQTKTEEFVDNRPVLRNDNIISPERMKII